MKLLIVDRTNRHPKPVGEKDINGEEIYYGDLLRYVEER